MLFSVIVILIIVGVFTALWLCDHLCGLPYWASSNLDSDVNEYSIVGTDCSNAKNNRNK